METEWVLFKSFNNPIDAQIVQGLLADNGIKAVSVNKKDTNYLFGEIELYVPTTAIALANLITQNNHN